MARQKRLKHRPGAGHRRLLAVAAAVCPGCRRFCGSSGAAEAAGAAAAEAEGSAEAACPASAGELELAPLRVTQIALRNERQMTDLIEHAASGGSWYRDGEAEQDLVKVVRFEDGELFLRDGHHRCIASLAGGRPTLRPTEYVIEDWEYSAWAAPNMTTGFITPYDPRRNIRQADLEAHREAVAQIVRDEGEDAAAAYIMAHPENYLAPGGRKGRDTLSDLLRTWERECREATQRWVEECVAWNARRGEAGGKSQAVAAAAIAPSLEPNFPPGWRAPNPLPPRMEFHLTELASRRSEALARYAEEGYAPPPHDRYIRQLTLAPPGQVPRDPGHAHRRRSLRRPGPSARHNRPLAQRRPRVSLCRRRGARHAAGGHRPGGAGRTAGNPQGARAGCATPFPTRGAYPQTITESVAFFTLQAKKDLRGQTEETLST